MVILGEEMAIIIAEDFNFDDLISTSITIMIISCWNGMTSIHNGGKYLKFAMLRCKIFWKA